MNIEVVSPTKIKLTSEAYITRMADRYVPRAEKNRRRTAYERGRWRGGARTSRGATAAATRSRGCVERARVRDDWCIFISIFERLAE